MVAPLNLRKRMMALIKRETEHALAGRPAHIQAKINRLTDLNIIELLYEASQAGVKIDLIVRGACMIRPANQDFRKRFTSAVLLDDSSNTVVFFTSQTVVRKSFTLGLPTGWRVISIGV